MMSISIILTISLIITVSLLLIGLLFSLENSSEMSDQMFECGFSSLFISRIPFSIHFFYITIVFLVFDLEVVIFIPFLLLKSFMINKLLVCSLVCFILIVGLIVEWADQSIHWSV